MFQRGADVLGAEDECLSMTVLTIGFPELASILMSSRSPPSAKDALTRSPRTTDGTVMLHECASGQTRTHVAEIVLATVLGHQKFCQLAFQLQMPKLSYRTTLTWARRTRSRQPPKPSKMPRAAA